MGDDLSQFFAKKSAKSKERRKKIAVNVDEVGEVLERRAKRQEERDHENAEEEKRIQEDAAFFEKRAEDSEWLEYKDSNKEIRLEGLAIRDMNLTEQIEETSEDEKAVPLEAAKTWSSVEPKEAAEVTPETQSEPIRPAKAAIWKPPALRGNASNRNWSGGNTAVPDIKNETVFPSFAEANEMEKSKNEYDKRRSHKNDGFTTVTGDREQPSNMRTGVMHGRVTSDADRAALLSTVKKVTTGGLPNPVPPPTLQRSANPYIPPSLRRREQAQHREGF
ncbi:hypothetical protein AB6A40_010982 [Gnathostoma spinigerum]|uniref:Uncharacterized protein n=1 Tax=Gnathostoma spinigerum TaxID=75299 RepID=A0ABD6EWX5_9BILA